MKKALAFASVSGLPGPMASAAALEILKSDSVELLDFALTGPNQPQTFELAGKTIRLFSPDERESFLEELKKYKHAIVVDYTHPSAVRGNVLFYSENDLPFVVGTTGGDPVELKSIAQRSQAPSVMAPNMALPLVGIMAMIEYAAKNFPAMFEGYELEVHESHQQGKADTSGTAKALIQQFQNMGCEFNMDKNIHLCRDPKIQEKDWGIPVEHLKGHAYHTYDIKSADGTSHFQLRHNILGRSIYGKGTVTALIFLAQKAEEGKSAGRVFSMIDVLKSAQQ